MREPSIHIKESDLKKILDEAELGNVNTNQLVKYILKRGKNYSLNHRKLLSSTKKVTQKAEKVLSSSAEDTALMNNVILLVRKRLKHRNISPYRPGTKDYTMLKTIAANAREFYNNYFEPDEQIKGAFVKYIELGSSKMQKFGISKIMSMHETICSTYEAHVEIMKDEHPELTNRALRWYNKLVVDKVGSLLNDYSKIPDKYVYFIRVAKYCYESGLSPETYIDAQFNGVEWRQGIPDPIQLTGNKSMEYLQNYLYKNPDLVKKNKSSNKEYINKLKDLAKW